MKGKHITYRNAAREPRSKVIGYVPKLGKY